MDPYTKILTTLVVTLTERGNASQTLGTLDQHFYYSFTVPQFVSCTLLGYVLPRSHPDRKAGRLVMNVLHQLMNESFNLAPFKAVMHRLT